MTLHYHGTPITPTSVLNELAGRNFCVSYAEPRDVARCHQLGQSVMLDNGAFSFWRSGKPTDWEGYYRWVEPWLEHRTTWAVIPDVIDGTSTDNDYLIGQWPFGQCGAPVWHMHESLDRLLCLAAEWDRVCIGSSAAYKFVGSNAWHHRMAAAMNALCGEGPAPVWLHMLRGMAMVGEGYPFASVDSTDIAQNHNRPQNTPLRMAERWDGIQAAPHWTPLEQLELA